MKQKLANFKRQLPRKLDQFARNDATGGVIMLFCTVLALILQNGSYSTSYRHWLEMQAGVMFGDFSLIKPLLLWINDGLITIFFFSIGLELKIEFVKGHLAEKRNIILPSLAAFGGIVVPSLFFMMFNFGHEYAMRGWAIPTATDTAFSLALLLLLGSRVPASLKIFLLSMSIFDDIGAIMVIALFYTSELSGLALISASFAILCLLILNYFGVARKLFYVFFGLILWFSIFKSGMHATLAGIITAFCIPMKDAQNKLMVEPIFDSLKMWVALLVLPVFTIANAGIDLSLIDINDFFSPVSLGIFTGLFLGKQLGIFAIVWLCIKFRVVRMPSDANFKQIYGVCILTGIGFSMSMFIDTLAYQGSSVFNYADSLAILVASLCSGIFGYCYLRFYACKISSIEYRPWLPGPEGYRGSAMTANPYSLEKPLPGAFSVAPTAAAVAEANARISAAEEAAAAAATAAQAAAAAAEAAQKVAETPEADDQTLARIQLAAAQAAHAAATAAVSTTKLNDSEDSEDTAEVAAAAMEAAAAAADIAAEAAEAVEEAAREAEEAEVAEAKTTETNAAEAEANDAEAEAEKTESVKSKDEGDAAASAAAAVAAAGTEAHTSGDAEAISQSADTEGAENDPDQAEENKGTSAQAEGVTAADEPYKAQSRSSDQTASVAAGSAGTDDAANATGGAATIAALKVEEVVRGDKTPGAETEKSAKADTEAEEKGIVAKAVAKAKAVVGLGDEDKESEEGSKESETKARAKTAEAAKDKDETEDESEEKGIVSKAVAAAKAVVGLGDEAKESEEVAESSDDKGKAKAKATEAVKDKDEAEDEAEGKGIVSKAVAAAKAVVGLGDKDEESAEETEDVTEEYLKLVVGKAKAQVESHNKGEEESTMAEIRAKAEEAIDKTEEANEKIEEGEEPHHEESEERSNDEEPHGIVAKAVAKAKAVVGLGDEDETKAHGQGDSDADAEVPAAPATSAAKAAGPAAEAAAAAAAPAAADKAAEGLSVAEVFAGQTPEKAELPPVQIQPDSGERVEQPEQAAVPTADTAVPAAEVKEKVAALTVEEVVKAVPEQEKPDTAPSEDRSAPASTLDSAAPAAPEKQE